MIPSLTFAFLILMRNRDIKHVECVRLFHELFVINELPLVEGDLVVSISRFLVCG